MRRCQRCRSNGVALDGSRLVCLYCGDVSADDTTDVTFTYSGTPACVSPSLSSYAPVRADANQPIEEDDHADTPR